MLLPSDNAGRSSQSGLRTHALEVQAPPPPPLRGPDIPTPIAMIIAYRLYSYH